LLMGYSCNQSAQTPDSPRHTSDELIEMNSEMLRYEDSLIANYLESQGIVMETSRTGLRMKWNKRAAEGKMPVSGNEVKVIYSMYLLDSTIAQEEIQISFKVDHADITNGMNEAVKRMKAEDEVFLIVPSHLGYGVHGKGNTVPSRATLLFNLKLVEIKS
jgi:FKBP-type peptidyl-prolyl cis-trans isomerase